MKSGSFAKLLRRKPFRDFLPCTLAVTQVHRIIIIIIIEQSWLRWINVKIARTPYKTKKTKAKGHTSSASSKK